MKQILKFGASWCSGCKNADRHIAKKSDSLGVEIKSIDVETDEATTIKYGIRNIPAFVVLSENGVEVDRLVGFNVTQFEAFIAKHRG